MDLKYEICKLTSLSDYSYCLLIFEIGIYFTEQINKKSLIYSKDFWDFMLLEVNYLDSTFLSHSYNNLTRLEVLAMYSAHLDYYFEQKILTLKEKEEVKI